MCSEVTDNLRSKISNDLFSSRTTMTGPYARLGAWRLVALLGAATLAHGRSAVGPARQSRDVSGRRAVQSTAHGIVRETQYHLLLRGGEADDAKTSDESDVVTRMRMRVASGTTNDPSICEISTEDAAAMGLEAGSHMTLRGRKQRRTTCVVVVDEKLSQGDARLSATALANVRLAEGEDVIVAPEDLPVATRALMLPFASDLDAFDGTADDAFEQALAPYLKDNERPLTVGDIVETAAGEVRVPRSPSAPCALLHPQIASCFNFISNHCNL